MQAITTETPRTSRHTEKRRVDTDEEKTPMSTDTREG